MDLGIAGKQAIVCASSRGLGRACAEALAAEGVAVVLNARDAETLERTADIIRSYSKADVTTVPGDVSDPKIQAALLAACPAPDILVNNNGGPPRRDFREIDREAAIQGVIGNMVTPIELVQKVVDGMAERGFGRIVNITSASVKTPLPHLDLSSAARAGLTAFLAGVARQVADRNVTINHILPGGFLTDRLRSSGPTDSARAARIPAKRFGDPDELGHLCAYLCSTHAGYITGQNFLIDGGSFPASF